MRLIEIVCTDRGQHDEPVHLPPVADVRDEGRGITYGGDSAEESRRPLTRVSKLASRDPDFLRTGGVDFRWYCPRCGRNPRISENNLARVIDALAASGEIVSEIDVSLLPWG